MGFLRAGKFANFVVVLKKNVSMLEIELFPHSNQMYALSEQSYIRPSGFIISEECLLVLVKDG